MDKEKQFQVSGVPATQEIYKTTNTLKYGMVANLLQTPSSGYKC